jgi:tetratricopeptide (TPR) repeat protein
MSWVKKFYTQETPLTGPLEETVELRQGTAEFEEFVVRTELESGENLAHGAFHLGNLLNFDPGNQEWMALFDQYFQKTHGELDALIPRGENLYAATEALRALIWYRQGRLNDAIELIVQVVGVSTPNYLHDWVLTWIEPEGKLESLPEARIQHLLALVLTNLPESRLNTATRLRQARRWACVSERVLPKMGDGPSLMARVGILRKAGLFDEALRIAKTAYETEPDWHKATALGLILRQKGDFKAAADAFEAALRLDPDDMTAYLEAGDMFFEAEHWQEACEWYQRALAKDHTQEWAKPSDLFCKWKLTEDNAVFDQLFELAQEGNQRAHSLITMFYDTPYDPGDATSNLLRQFQEEVGPEISEKGQINIGVSSLEAPSNQLAFTQAFAAIDVNFDVAEIPEPDPRQPVDAVRYTLWKYEGTTAKPALPVPSERVRNAIAELAEGSFHRERSFALASYVAEQLGPQTLPEILAVMVHPPKLPAGRDVLEFIPRIQLEAMHVAAQVDEGWLGSERRIALLSVLFGPTDWTTNAAINVLAFLAQRNPSIAYDVHKAFHYLEQCHPGGYCCWEKDLYRCWRRLPLLSEDERDELWEKLQALQTEPDEE